jgi:hypothetical protein
MFSFGSGDAATSSVSIEVFLSVDSKATTGGSEFTVFSTLAFGGSFSAGSVGAWIDGEGSNDIRATIITAPIMTTETE